MSTYCNDVNDWLLVGGDLDLAEGVTGQDYAETIAQLREQGVTHVLDLRIEYDDAEAWVDAGLPAEHYSYVPIVDERGYWPSEGWFVDVETAVGKFWSGSAHGDRLYVHCFMGCNRGPSAAMLALLTVEPDMHPYQAFLAIREARPVAGVRYAEPVGIRHLLNAAGMTGDDIATKGMPQSVLDFRALLADYWTDERREEHGTTLGALTRTLSRRTLEVH